MFTKCLVTHSVSDDGLNRVWYWSFQKGCAITTRPLTLGAVLDLATDLSPEEWALLQQAMKQPGTWAGK